MVGGFGKLLYWTANETTNEVWGGGSGTHSAIYNDAHLKKVREFT